MRSLAMILLFALGSWCSPFCTDLNPLQWAELDTVCLESAQKSFQAEEWMAPLKDQGYLFANLLSTQSSKDTLHLKWTRGPLYVLDRIAYTAPVRTQVSRLERFWGLQQGRAIQMNWLQNLPLQLEELPYLKLDTLYFARLADRHSMVLAVGLRELPTQKLDLALAGSQNELKGRLDLDLANIAGSLRDFRLYFENQNTGREIGLSYLEPWLGSLAIGARIEGNWLQRDSVSQSMSLKFAMGKWWSRPWSYQLQSTWFGILADSNFALQWGQSYGVGLSWKGMHQGISVNADRLDQVGGNSQRYWGSWDGKWGSSWRLESQVKVAWTQHQLESSSELWRFKLLSDDFRGLRQTLYLPQYALGNIALLHRNKQLCWGGFVDLLSREMGQQEWALGPTALYLDASAQHEMKISIALDAGNWAKSLLHFGYSHRF